MHSRNRHQDRYDLKALSQALPALSSKVIKTKYGDDSIDFSDPLSVRLLNQAILKHHYQIIWDVPDKFLSPPIPGRADYIHHLADLVGAEKKNIRVLDIGVGANCIYPILGVSEYGWDFVGSDINPEALKVAQNIVNANPKLKPRVELRLQTDNFIFQGLVKKDESFDLTLCNPPFHSSEEEARAGSNRKWRNLGKKDRKDSRNFGGIGSELWTPGGELSFIKQMIHESKDFAKNFGVFTTLISKEENLPPLMQLLAHHKAESKIIEMSQGQKKSRILCWRF